MSTNSDSEQHPRNLRDLEEGRYHDEIQTDLARAIYQDNGLLVWLNNEDEVHYQIQREHYGEWPQSMNEVEARVALLRALNLDHLPRVHRRHINWLIGEAIGICLALGTVRQCQEVLNQARKYFESRSAEVARHRYLRNALVGAAISALAALIAWLAREKIDSWFQEGAHEFLLPSFISGIGAFISIYMRLDRISVSPIGEWNLALESIGRFVVAYCAGFVIGVLFKGEVILSAALVDASNLPMLFVLALFAGMSERWLPTLAAQILHGEAQDVAKRGGRVVEGDSSNELGGDGESAD